jgi:hypothetical protein
MINNALKKQNKIKIFRTAYTTRQTKNDIVTVAFG